MFTGIVEEMGIVKGIQTVAQNARKFRIGCKLVMEDINIGDSLAVNGVCLTIVERNKGEVAVEAVEETIKKTTLGQLKTGEPVNLERAAAMNSRIGGHFVQGHVDAKGKVMSVQKLPLSRVYRFRIDPGLMKYITPVGSVAINGVSLTVAEKLKDSFKVAIIPHTYDNTVFKHLQVGSEVNVETDMIAKLVVSTVEPYIGSMLRK